MAALLRLPRALFAIVFFTLNTFFWSIFLFAFAGLRALCPTEASRRWCTRCMLSVAERWIAGNLLEIRWFSSLRWDVSGLEGLRNDRSYLVIANHQSWVDIVMLQGVFNRRIPFIRFFLKQQLRWVPVLGAAWAALDFPFMKRHSKEYLAKHPEKRDEDLETTRRACERFRGSPITVLNFLEGTRLTPAKHRAQASPYEHLLAPKAGGFAYVLECMGDQFDAVLDVTLVYPDGPVTMWDLFTGRLKNVIVRVEQREIPRELLTGHYTTDAQDRARAQSWVRETWERKDQLIANLRARASGLVSRPRH